MNFINYFNKATKKFTDYFIYNEKDNEKHEDIFNNIISINNQINLWIEDRNYDDEQYIQIINHYYKNNYIIYNLIPRKIETKTDLDKIIDYPIINLPSYSLEFLLTFSITCKNWLNSNKNNILILHDTIESGKIFCLLSAILSYLTKENPIKIYKEMLPNICKKFDEYLQKSDSNNHIRYLNYYSLIQKNPLMTFKKMYLKSVVINGAPAIENQENSENNPYITINQNSYYSPVLRISSGGKIIFCSYKKGDDVDKLFYSENNVKFFGVENFIFSDVCIEILHKGKKNFRQLFVIQFNTFFINDNDLKLNKEEIDSINRDIRYPKDFFVDIIFDNNKDEQLSIYDEFCIRWKSLFSDFILKSIKNEKEKNENNNNNNNEIVSKENELNKINEEKKIENKIPKNKNKEDDELMPINSSNTVNKVNDLLKQINNDKEEEEEDEDEDVENYLKNLENQKK